MLCIINLWNMFFQTLWYAWFHASFCYLFLSLEVHGDDFVDFLVDIYSCKICYARLSIIIFILYLISNLYSFDAKKFRFCVVQLYWVVGSGTRYCVWYHDVQPYRDASSIFSKLGYSSHLSLQITMTPLKLISINTGSVQLRSIGSF